MESIQGKHFSITDPEGVSTVIYRINKTAKEYLQDYPKYTVERLVFSEEIKGNLKRKGIEIYNPSPIGLPTELSELMLVIDGEKVTMEEFQKLKPTDIKSITVLKGEPAAKRWGTEAVNGVIEVNTNKK